MPLQASFHVGADTVDELHVVSDLHFGGVDGGQIFSGTTLLASFIDSLTAKPRESRVRLVIGGDFIDFLAEPGAIYFDPDGAVDKLARIGNDATFQPIWLALRRFVATLNRRLVIILGNHDVELALPHVRSALTASLCDDDAARGRLDLIVDGTGYAARLGGARILCLHGNEVDDWNVTDFESLRRIGQARQLGNAYQPWTPNAGSKLVIDVMNGIKRTYPFVDLLKPETEAVVPILIALDQATAERVAAACSVAARLVGDKIKRAVGLLSVEEDDGEPSTPVESGQLSLEAILRTRLSSLRGESRVAAGGRLSSRAAPYLDKAVAFVSQGQDPLMLESGDGELGTIGALWSWLRGKDKVDVLLAALTEVQHDQSFNPEFQDPTFRLLDERVGPDVHFLVAGHTHLERAVNRRGAGCYFNSGTWARLIRLEPAVLASREKFEPILKSLTVPSIREMESDPLLQNRLIHIPTLVSFYLKSGVPTGALRHLRMDNDRPVFDTVKEV
jgi:UDP-2,3-diacylglucosamine pyrophosphatase LpxH